MSGSPKVEESASNREKVSFASADGTKLFGTMVRAEAPKGLALIVHGYAEHSGRYDELSDCFASAGISSFRFDFRGHGLSEGARGHISKFENYLQDLEAALAVLEEESEEPLPMLLAGHSNGGLVSLHYLADPFRVSRRIVAAVISSPFLALKMRSPAKEFVGKIASRLMPKLAMPNGINSEVLTHDKEKIAEHDADPLVNDVANARWFTETMSAQEWLLEYAHRIEVPTLWLVAGSDELADPAGSRAVKDRIKAPLDYREFPDMFHEVLNESERAPLYQLIREFAEEQIRK